MAVVLVGFLVEVTGTDQEDPLWFTTLNAAVLTPASKSDAAKLKVAS